MQWLFATLVQRILYCFRVLFGSSVVPRVTRVFGFGGIWSPWQKQRGVSDTWLRTVGDLSAACRAAGKNQRGNSCDCYILHK